MDHFVYNPQVVIPEDKRSDCKKIVRCLRKFHNIEITLRDAYLLWCDISEYWDVSWIMSIEDIVSNEWFLDEIQAYGTIIHDYCP